jgi:hypothetical protein
MKWLKHTPYAYKAPSDNAGKIDMKLHIINHNTSGHSAAWNDTLNQTNVKKLSRITSATTKRTSVNKITDATDYYRQQ